MILYPFNLMTISQQNYYTYSVIKCRKSIWSKVDILHQTLEKFGFGKSYIQWIKIDDSTTKAIVTANEFNRQPKHKLVYADDIF